MEPVRNWLKRAEPVPQVSDEDIFIEEIMVLLTPHLHTVLEEMNRELFVGTQCACAEEMNRRLMRKFFNLARTDKGLNKFMIPIMMYLRSARMKRGIK